MARPLDFRAVVLRAVVLPVVPFALVAPPVELRLVVPEDFAARVEPAFLIAAVPDERDLAAVERDFVDRFAAVERVPVEREPVDRAPVERPPVLRLDDPAEVPPSSSPQLPLITRCAASATASAISEPSRVALDIAVVAALDAASAASRPASRILRRAAGLALIAAAAAASPAASISRLIAALAILSTVVSLDPEEEPEEDEDFLLDLAIVGLPLSERKTLQTRNGSRKPRIVAAMRRRARTC